MREVREEAGIDVKLKGVLKYMQLVGSGEEGSLPLGQARFSMIFYAEPSCIKEAHNLKHVADDESVQAAWFTVEELR